jgi:hypothetical protein
MRADRLGGPEGDQVEMLNGWPVGRKGHIFRSRVSADGSQVQVRVRVQDLNFTRHLHLYLKTRARDLRAETWDLKIPLTFAPLHRP